MNPMKLSVVIPTHNRCELLVAILDSLNQVEHLPGEMEVIVVDDGSQDSTAQMLSQRKDHYALHRIWNETPQGPSIARNQGAAAARGEILGFLDSDVLAQSGWWQAAKKRFADPGVAVVEGATLLPPGSDQPTPFSHFVSNLRGNSFQTCNLFCRKIVFEEIGGFDERFSWKKRNGKIGHVREDTDLAFSILEKGHSIVFEPDAKAFHPLFPAPRSVYFQKTFHGPYEILLRRKHPEMYKKYLNWIDGRAFPVFYWGIFLGLPIGLIGVVLNQGWLILAGSVGFFMGWVGSVYAVCRRRKVGFLDSVLLGLQFLVIPWMRLFWVTVGFWKFRHVKTDFSLRTSHLSGE